ncbi:MAG TPA: hypothetical protein PKC45_03515 [Gemmatales bacterium]|nr:hypothetical protein [Gemmatales bacterium]
MVRALVATRLRSTPCRTLFLVLVLGALLPAQGCSGIGVKPAPLPMPFDNWRFNLGPERELSPRSRQTLRAFDVESTYRQDRLAALRLLQERLPDPPPRDAVFALAELSYQLGLEADEKRRPEATEYFYLCAGYAYHYLFDPLSEARMATPGASALPMDSFDPRFRLAAELYNTGLAQCLRAAQRAGVLDARTELRLAGDWGGSSRLEVTHHGFPWRPEEFGPLLFCSDFQVTGLVNHYRQFGLGVPLICTRRPVEGVPCASHYPEGLTFPVTAFFRFPGTIRDLGQQHVGQLELYNPLTVHEVQVAGWAIPLENDLTTPLAYYLSHSQLEKLAYVGFFKVEQVQKQAGIYLAEPYDPTKIPVLFVHGMLSTPLTWAPLVNDLLADPAIRSRYQFWFYLYPTGQPYLLSAADLRRRLVHLRATVDPDVRDEVWNEMVLVGHSMGGLIARLMTVEGGDDFWGLASQIPIAGLPLPPERRRELEEVFYFPRFGEARRVVFMGTPHRGSTLSPSLLGRLARRLVQLPRQWQENAELLVQYSVSDPMRMMSAVSPRRVWGPPPDLATSVDMLAPGAPALELIEQRPRPTDVAYHSVVGVIPAQDWLTTLAQRLRYVDQVSDGVVPYESAHMPEAASELVVTADHMTVHQHPLAVQEVRRILLEHLAQLKRAEVVPASAPPSP